MLYGNILNEQYSNETYSIDSLDLLMENTNMQILIIESLYITEASDTETKFKKMLDVISKIVRNITEAIMYNIGKVSKYIPILGKYAQHVEFDFYTINPNINILKNVSLDLIKGEERSTDDISAILYKDIRNINNASDIKVEDLYNIEHKKCSAAVMASALKNNNKTLTSISSKIKDDTSQLHRDTATELYAKRDPDLSIGNYTRLLGVVHGYVRLAHEAITIVMKNNNEQLAKVLKLINKKSNNTK